MYVSPLTASAERWIGSRQRWSGIRALFSQDRQKRVVDARRCSASSASSGYRELLGPRKRAVGSLARLEHVPCPHSVALDPEREVGLEANRLSGTRRVRGVPAAVDQCPLSRLAAVAEDGLADELDLHRALEAFDGAHQHVVRVVVRRRTRVRRDRVLVVVRTHRQRRADEDPAVRCLPGRRQDVRPGLVLARRRMVDAERRQLERPRPSIEQAAEHARRVEAGHAEPVDRAVRRHERPRMAVGDERVVRDRRERRRCGGALGSASSRRLRGAHDTIQGSRQRP